MSDADLESENPPCDAKEDIEQPLMANKPRLPRRTLRKNRFKRKRKLTQCILTTAVVLIVLGVTAALVYAFTIPDYNEHYIRQPESRVRRILLFGNVSMWGIEHTNIDSEYLGCPIKDCYIEVRKPFTAYYKRFDAIVLTPDDDVNAIYGYRLHNHNQMIVYANQHTLMNPTQTLDTSKLIFNLTMTYRTDSDIVWNNYEVRHKIGYRVAPAIYPFWESFDYFNQTKRNQILSLTKTVERRLNFATIRICRNNTINALVYEEMKNYISPPAVIDVDYVCGYSHPYEQPYLRKYKFMLAFEEDLCTDKISGDFYGALQENVIPVVLGGPIVYSHFAPPHSYIRAQNFHSIRELVEYLHHLDENPTEYAEYLWWTHTYSIRWALSPLCQLCDILSNRNQWENNHGSPDWWIDNKCYKTIPLLSRR